jgi:transcriptional regulator with XRE-family HTH domain
MPTADEHPSTVNVLAERIVALRTAQGWRREELAVRADLGIATVATLERGDRPAHIHTVERLAAAFGVDVAELVSSGPMTTTTWTEHIMTSVQQRGRGRPPIGRPLTIRIDPDTTAWLHSVAADNTISVAELVRWMVDVARGEIAAGRQMPPRRH